jgi:hypothetical protein
MITAIAITPIDFFFSVYGVLGIIVSLLAIVLTIFAIYALKKMIKLGSSINEGISEVKGKIRKTTKLFDLILNLFSGEDSEEEDDEEVFVRKKKK